MKKFTTKDLLQIKTAIQKAEQKTTGEIVPLLVNSADTYHEGTLILLILTISGFSTIYCSLAWPAVSTLLLGQLITAVITLLLCKIFPRLKIFFVSKNYIRQKTQDHAYRAFLRYRINQTKKHTGILIALFWQEKRVEIIADQGISKKCPQQTWENIVKIIVASAKKGKVIQGFCQGISECGKILTKHFPLKQKRNPNEIADRLIVE